MRFLRTARAAARSRQSLPKHFAAKSVAQRPAARSRPRAEGCSYPSQARPLGCGLVPRLGTVCQDRAGRSFPVQRLFSGKSGLEETERAAASPGEGPLLAYRSCRPSQAATRIENETVAFFILRDARLRAILHGINRATIGGPQPGSGGGPQLLAVACDLRRLPPELEHMPPGDPI